MGVTFLAPEEEAEMVLHKAIQAAREGDLATLRDLASSGHLSHAISDTQGAGLVHHAARVGHLDCLQFLVSDLGLPADAEALNRATPVHDAAATGNVRELQWLVNQGGCNFEVKDAAGATALHLAARFGHMEIIRWLLSVGGVAGAETKCGAVPAHYSAANGGLTCLKLLIQEAPGCVNHQTRFGVTPLYLACQEGHLHVVEYLVKDCGADAHLRSHDGMTCLHAAAHMGHDAVVEWLMTCTDVGSSCQDREGATALHFAASRGHYCILEKLLRMGSKVIKDYWGGTPLHDAAENGEMECCKVLLASGANPTDQDIDGFTAADLAEYNGHSECARYLRAVEKHTLSADKSIRVITPVEEEEEEVKPALSVRRSKEDYYGSLSRGCRDSHMDSLKQPECEEPPQARYPQPPPALPPPSASSSTQSGRTAVGRIEQIQLAASVIKVFNQSKSSESETAVSAEKTVFCGTNLLAERKLLGDLKSIKSLSDSGMSGVFTGQANKMVVLPTEEANLSDIDYLVPTHDERGHPIAEWKRQVMVRQLQARLLDEEDQRRRENGNRYAKVSWRYSQAHNAILGPSGELLTEDDLIYLEQQIANVSMQRNSAGYELELARLAEELRHILPAPIVNITVNTQFRNFKSQVPLPVWCGRISGIVKSMSLLMTNLTDHPYCKMPNTELITVFSQAPDRQFSTRIRRETIEDEIHQFGVSVRTLKFNFEMQNSSPSNHPQEAVLFSSSMQPGEAKADKQPKGLKPPPEMDQNGDSGIDNDENGADVQETISLRKERIVVLFLGHWKKSAYSITLKSSDDAERKVNEGNPGTVDKSGSAGKDPSPSSQPDMMSSALGHFFKQRSAVNKMLGNWRKMISSVPSRQIRRLHRQKALFSPEQFLPRLDGVPVEYDSLTLDLFMLGYFHILELDLPVDERKMRHLLCFEVFDRVGKFPWETVREFHKAVVQDIEAGNREWTDGFEDIKVSFFGNTVSQSKDVAAVVKHSLPEVRKVPKVIVQTPTPDEGVLYGGTDISSFSNEEICQYIDRSFAFWKEKEAEIFDFE
ncbi:espin-like protein isoform X2 [Nothobranchius furzeri]|uniref:Espin-like n=1 Tax=Nothobranchius furzeri TaxID=105023 RepID=A0A1A8UJF8_NOTFU|nr:transcript variant X2 [Nothobranchius furzeri]